MAGRKSAPAQGALVSETQPAKKAGAAGAAAASSKSRSKPIPSAKTKGGTKRKSTDAPMVDTASPTSTASTVTPTPRKRKKPSQLNSSQQTETSTSKYETPMFNGRAFWDIGDIHKADDEEEDYFGFATKSRASFPKTKKARKLGKQSSSATIVQAGEEDDSDDQDSSELEEENIVVEEPSSPQPGPSRRAFVPTTLPPRMQDFDTKPPLLVKCQRNWFPAYLVNFYPVETREEATKRKRDLWEVDAHPATGWKKSRKVRAGDIMYVDDARIATCTLGHISSEGRRFTCDAKSRAQSPDLPLDPTTETDPEEFANFSRSHQIRLLRPHLHDIISERYPPAQARIDLFYKSYRGSTQALRGSILYGDISTEEVVEVFLPELQRWMRGCKPDDNGGVDQEVIPHGSERFETLSLPQRRDFIQLVLVPEAIIRICIAASDTDTLLTYLPPPEDSEENVAAGMEDVDMSALTQSLKNTNQQPALEAVQEEVNTGAKETRDAEIAGAPSVADPVSRDMAEAQEETREVPAPEVVEQAPGKIEAAVEEAGKDEFFRGEVEGDQSVTGGADAVSEAEAEKQVEVPMPAEPAEEVQAKSPVREQESEPLQTSTAVALHAEEGDEGIPGTDVRMGSEPEEEETLEFTAPTEPEAESGAETGAGTGAVKASEDVAEAAKEAAQEADVEMEAVEVTEPAPGDIMAPNATETDLVLPPASQPIVDTVQAPEPILPSLAPASAPAPPPETHPTQATIYNLAMRYLSALAADSSSIHWDLIINEINVKRMMARRDQGLPEEKMSEFEKESERLKDGIYEKSFFGDMGGGRVRKKHNYAEVNMAGIASGSPAKKAKAWVSPAKKARMKANKEGN